MDLPDKKVLKSEQNNMYLTYFRRIYKQTLFRDQEAVGSNPATRTKEQVFIRLALFSLHYRAFGAEE